MSVSAPSSRAEEVRGVSQLFFFFLLAIAHVEMDAGSHQIETLPYLQYHRFLPIVHQLTMVMRAAPQRSRRPLDSIHPVRRRDPLRP